MPDALPQRAPMLWLPGLGDLVEFDPRWGVSDGGAHAFFMLRVWRAGAGHFAVVTELGTGRSVTHFASVIRRALAAQYGEPLALAEHWPADQSPEAGEHWDLVLPPYGPGGHGWTALWPVGRRHPHREVLTAWWEAHQAVITGIPA